jgi:hypothetical protein
MSDGFFYWYRQTWRPGDAAQVLQAMEQAGIRVANPVTQLVTTLTDGPESWGEQFVTDRDGLIAAADLTSADEVTFRLWLDGDTDLVTRVRRLRGTAAVIEFGLDGLAERQEWAVTAIMKAVRGAWSDCLGLVVDRQGRTEEADWDVVVLFGSPVPDPWPDTLGIRQTVAARNPRFAATAGSIDAPLVILGAALPAQ